MDNRELSNKEMWNKVFKKFTIVSLMIAIVLIACYIMNLNGFGDRRITAGNKGSSLEEKPSNNNITSEVLENNSYLETLKSEMFNTPDVARENLDKFYIITAEQYEAALDNNGESSGDAEPSETAIKYGNEDLYAVSNELNLPFEVQMALNFDAKQIGTLQGINTYYKYFKDTDGNFGLVEIPFMSLEGSEFIFNEDYNRMSQYTAGVSFNAVVDKLPNNDITVEDLINDYLSRTSGRDVIYNVNDAKTFGYVEYQYTKDDYMTTGGSVMPFGTMYMIVDSLGKDSGFTDKALVTISYNYPPLSLEDMQSLGYDEEYYADYAVQRDKNSKLLQKYCNYFGIEPPSGLYKYIW